jgi:hypothetical protein
MAACEAMTPEALKTIVNLMLHADKESVRLQAAAFIIERRFGKSVEHKETRVGPLDDATTAELLEMKRIVRLRLEHRSTPEAATAEEGVWVSPSRNP